MDPQEKKLFAFLIGNMKNMETELRAHSIVFDALVKKVITVDDLGDALHMARHSTAMLEMIREKYELLDAEAAKDNDWNGAMTTQPLHVVN